VHEVDPLRELERYEEFLKIKPLWWDTREKKFTWLDTRLIPFEEVYHTSGDYRRIAEAIRTMEIRGAPAIGVSAAFAMAAAAYNEAASGVDDLVEKLRIARSHLAATRPTAYNLFWALDRVWKRVERAAETGDPDEVRAAVEDEALRIYVEDIRNNIEMGRIGSRLIEDGATILTHCNTGALATAGFGTALGVIRYAFYEGKRVSVITTETRPVLQGARLNVWELRKEGIPVTLITDGMVGLVLSRGMADLVLVGADRIILTGHTANKIGTYMVALAANANSKPFYVVAPTSTIQAEWDPAKIVIEERDPDEVRRVMGKYLITLPDVDVYNPSFDVTPPELITGIITEKGIARPPYRESLPALVRLQ
jgi:S-methyl-5-thioribose-1-phosphate isomerase